MTPKVSLCPPHGSPHQWAKISVYEILRNPNIPATKYLTAVRLVRDIPKRIARLKTETPEAAHGLLRRSSTLDMLKSEMGRLTSEMTAAEGAIAAAKRAVADLKGTLEAALAIAGQRERHYVSAEPKMRRMIKFA